MRAAVKGAISAAVLAVGLAACSANTLTPPPSQVPGHSTVAAQPPSAALPSTATPTWGDKVTFPGGLAVTAVYDGTVAASDTAANATTGRVATWSVTVTNGSNAPVDGALLSSPTATYGAQGQQVQSVFDTEQGIGGFLTTINPGESQTVKIGFSIPAAGASQVRLEFTAPSFTDAPAVFKGAVQP
jgi:hypothetical protein